MSKFCQYIYNVGFWVSLGFATIFLGQAQMTTSQVCGRAMVEPEYNNKWLIALGKMLNFFAGFFKDPYHCEEAWLTKDDSLTAAVLDLRK